jgi:5-(carboxyamino)imidazole ribonucleotide mutase
MKVAVLMGSVSDEEVVFKSRPYFDYFGIEVEYHIMSAHRNPEQVKEFASKASENGYSLIIACAGMAAHLGGVIASYTTLPVLGVPLAGSALNGVDALYSMVQMPAGVPVATFAIGSAGIKNAAVFAAQIGALTDEKIRKKLEEFKKSGSKL